jgi:hypothetical protein
VSKYIHMIVCLEAGKLLHEAGTIRPGAVGACFHRRAGIHERLLGEDRIWTTRAPRDALVHTRDTSDAGAIDEASRTAGECLCSTVPQEKHCDC